MKDGWSSKNLEKIKTKRDLLKVLSTIPICNKKQRNNIVCSLVGHSRIQDVYFGYYYCGRCRQQLGDSLTSIYPFAEKVVIIGHNCDKCRKNYKQCSWKDKIFVSNPFKKESNNV